MNKEELIGKKVYSYSLYNEAQEKLDMINEKKYLEYPMLKGA